MKIINFLNIIKILVLLEKSMFITYLLCVEKWFTQRRRDTYDTIRSNLTATRILSNSKIKKLLITNAKEISRNIMCTAATYKTKGFYLDAH